MKQLLTVFFVYLILGGNVKADTIDSAHYFRVWQGFQRRELSGEQFLAGVASFMKDTVDIYRVKALNNYIVIIPPANKPAYIPDELALVALNTKENYDAIRATPEGQAYSARHWDFFDRSTSKSATMVEYTLNRPTALENNVSYNMMGKDINWAIGFNTVFIGTKKPELTSPQFLQQLQNHIENAKAVMGPKGLLGYVMIANNNYEVAYLNWESKAAHDAAGETIDGKAVFAEGGQIMDVLMYQEAVRFDSGNNIAAGHAYSNLQR